MSFYRDALGQVAHAARATPSSPPAASRSRWCCPSGKVAYRGGARLAGAQARQAQAGHRQPAPARELPQGRGAARDVHVVVAGRAGVAGDRGPHLRGVRARRAADSRVYQICDTTSCQVYGGFSAEYASTNTAIDATGCQVRLDAAGQPAFTQFSSSNGGWTAAGSQPYLVAQEDPYDGWSGNPQHHLDAAPHRRQRREELPRHRHPDLDRRRHPRRQRRVGRPGAGHDARRGPLARSRPPARSSACASAEVAGSRCG